jgi:2-(1,2-epoxy-1,2-dihydrophenyl)acetyl-CoA isomerase
MSNDIVLQHLASGLLTITMNRPDRRNALNADMTMGLVAAALQKITRSAPFC